MELQMLLSRPVSVPTVPFVRPYNIPRPRRITPPSPKASSRAGYTGPRITPGISQPNVFAGWLNTLFGRPPQFIDAEGLYFTPHNHDSDLMGNNPPNFFEAFPKEMTDFISCMQIKAKENGGENTDNDYDFCKYRFGYIGVPRWIPGGP